jgi:hypothetical protein
MPITPAPAPRPAQPGDTRGHAVPSKRLKDLIEGTVEPAGHPTDAFDTAAIIHLTDYQQ